MTAAVLVWLVPWLFVAYLAVALRSTGRRVNAGLDVADDAETDNIALRASRDQWKTQARNNGAQVAWHGGKVW